ncbi:glycosyltransferase family 4 protein [Thiohalobacter sp. IOR34]|uniref:glycosyltransferase family 4 protein n=1 Tax=Thiohalobacter sp. IOR34 TaxID=3057176 RepID=UPI0025B0D3EB|nr:glycosyltransferase family 4 protein [Thiohalobacter sp. IOR34]WJW75299.1 glycosyltransferase family 4 protein [Thiohalobacter sp. IOR34]
MEDWGLGGRTQVARTTVASDLVSGFSIQDKLACIKEGGEIKALFLARLVREKGPLEAMQAVVKLREEGWPLTLTVAGEGSCMPEVREFAGRHDPEGRYLSVVGDVRGARKREILETHHVYVFPTSYGEGMPTSVLEAMVFGMAVVTSPVGGVADFFEEGSMGYLVRDNSVESIVSAVRRLLLNPSGMERICKFNNEFATGRFLAPVVAEMLMRAYDEVACLS